VCGRHGPKRTELLLCHCFAVGTVATRSSDWKNTVSASRLLLVTFPTKPKQKQAIAVLFLLRPLAKQQLALLCTLGIGSPSHHIVLYVKCITQNMCVDNKHGQRPRCWHHMWHVYHKTCRLSFQFSFQSVAGTRGIF
jgi:hypothetical protein